MKDFGTSDDPAVQAQLDRLAELSLPDGRIGLETVRELLARLGDPHKRLPPVFHVAGTNGKGSVCAFLRAMLEADGKTVHVTTSPHLVRYNERIRVAGDLISDARLAELLKEVLDAADGLNPSFFEVTVAAAFTEFARVPADACIVEVGLGGRFDATNVIEKPAASAIATLGIDHERFLLVPEEGVPKEPLARIAFEKAGILKHGVPFATMTHPLIAETEIVLQAGRVGAVGGNRWDVAPTERGFSYASPLGSFNDLPKPSLPGDHQIENAGLAIAMMQIANYSLTWRVVEHGLQSVQWPGRLQRLSPGPLIGEREVWLDGGHNPDAGAALEKHFAGQKLHLIIGMIEGKNPNALLGPLADSLATVTSVPISTHDHYPASKYGNQASDAPSLAEALAALPDDGLPVLIAGSLYLAGDVLRLNNELPD